MGAWTWAGAGGMDRDRGTVCLWLSYLLDMPADNAYSESSMYADWESPVNNRRRRRNLPENAQAKGPVKPVDSGE